MIQTNYSIHEVANIFPMMTDVEYAELLEDIRENGQREPITVYQNQIIDGRNRYKACQEINIEPKIREWDGQGSLTSLVISLNMKRRHLTASQKAAIAVEVLPMLEAEAKERQGKRNDLHPNFVEKVPQSTDDDGKSRTQAAKLVGTNPRYVSDAKRIQQEAPELIDMMKSGEININKAKQYASLPQENREKLLDNLPKQEEGKTKACNECGELLPIDRFPSTASTCYPCRNIKYKKPKTKTLEPVEEIDEEQEWLNSQVSTFNGHLEQVVMFFERNENLEEIINQGITTNKEFYEVALRVFNTISSELKKQIEMRMI